MPDLAALIPVGKFDTDKAEAIVTLGFPAVEPILPALLHWMQDMNWPVAKVLQPFLASIGAPLASHVRAILQTDDEVWKSWVLQYIVAESRELARMLQPELARLAASPTPAEREEEVDHDACKILEQLSTEPEM